MKTMYSRIARLVLGLVMAAAPAAAQSDNAETEPAPASSEKDSHPDAPAAMDAPAAPDAQGEPDAQVPMDGPWMKGVTAETQEAAREIFLQGNALIKDTLFAKAAGKYKEAIALWQHPAFYFNLAIAQLALDQPIEAHGSLEQALRHGEKPLGEQRYRQAKSHLQRLDRELAHIEVTCDEPGATLTLDGELLFKAPGRHEGLVRPGDHQLVAGKTGYLTRTRQLVLSPGQRLAIDIEMTTLEDARDSSRRWAAWKPWAVVGAGALVGVAGGVLHWRAAADFRGFDNAFKRLDCADAGGCEEDTLSSFAGQLQRAVWEQRIAVTAYAVGGVVLATGLTMAYVNRPRLAESEAGDAEAVSVIPVVSPRAAGVTALWRF